MSAVTPATKPTLIASKARIEGMLKDFGEVLDVESKFQRAANDMAIKRERLRKTIDLEVARLAEEHGAEATPILVDLYRRIAELTGRQRQRVM